MPEENSQTGMGAGESAVSTGSTSGGLSPHTMICPACAATYPSDTRFCPLDGSSLRSMTSEADDLVGNILDGRYFVIEKIGQGGMGEVYLGEHVLTRRRCAVKVVKRILAADPDAFGRFIREATNAGRISHPHVATVYDFGKTEDGTLYLAMEYVDGESLSTLLEREGALHPVRAVEIARQVAEAVGAAHDLGIVHRDLKPGNILIARDRRGGDVVKVVDFGIARATTDEQQHLTRTGLVIGTPEYMSPEQLIGDPVDARADIYALGCILYQMLTGRHAYTGSAAHLITRRLTEPPPRPRDANPAIPKALDEVVVTALGRTPQDRFQTMDALRDALLAAPAQLITTTPKRIAAWLGLKSGREQRQPGEAASPTQEARAGGSTSERPQTVASGAPPTAGPRTVAPHEPTGQQAEVVAEPPTKEATMPPSYFDRTDAVELSEPAAPDEPGDIGEVEVAEPLPYDEPRPEPPRPSLMPKIALGVGAVAVAVIVGLTLYPRGTDADDVATANPDSAAIIPLPPPVPDSVLAHIRSELLVAEQENGDERFAEAIARLRGVQTDLTQLSATYAYHADVQILADSANAQLERVEKRCNAALEIARSRNEPLPVCEIS